VTEITYAVSDLHGCYSDFIKLMDKICFSSSDELYILGDTVDIGPEPIRLIKCIMGMPNVFPLFGNCEYAMMKAFRFPENTGQWPGKHSLTTMRGFVGLCPGEANAILEYISEMDLYAETEIGGKKFVMTHSGAAGDIITKPAAEMAMTDLIFNIHRPEKEYFPGCFTLFGHVPTLCYGRTGTGRILYGKNCCDIDCGCAHRDLGGRLGCLRLDDMAEFYV